MTRAWVMSSLLALAACGSEPVGYPSIDTAGGFGSYSSEEVDYFLEVALNTEFGGGDQLVHKWQEDVRIKVHGEPSASDLAVLDEVVGELNTIQDSVTLSVVAGSQNVDLYFTSTRAFRVVEPNYVPGNMGFFWTYWSRGAIYAANIFVSSEQPEAYRHHLLREELTQSLGLMHDSTRYPESIFFADWTDTDSYLSIDRSIIEMLYRDDIAVNMDEEDVLAVLAGR